MSGQVQALASSLGPLASYIGSQARDLGVIIDGALKLDKQVSPVIRASFFQLWLLCHVKPYLRRADLERVVHAFISSPLDYCNSLYVGINQSELNLLVQNAEARLLIGTKIRERITPGISSLHWLPVSYRIDLRFFYLFLSPYIIWLLNIDRASLRCIDPLGT